MASMAEVAALDEQGMEPKEIAKALDIGLNTVYAHLRKAGRARGAKHARRARVAAATLAAAPAQEQAAINGNANGGLGEVLPHIRATIADAVEHLESELAIKRAEVVAASAAVEELEAQHAPLMSALDALAA